MVTTPTASGPAIAVTVDSSQLPLLPSTAITRSLTLKPFGLCTANGSAPATIFGGVKSAGETRRGAVLYVMMMLSDAFGPPSAISTGMGRTGTLPTGGCSAGGVGA